MGCDTRLHISSKWRLDEVLEVMESHLPLKETVTFKMRYNHEERKKKRTKIVKKIEVYSCHETQAGMFTLHFALEGKGSQEGRMMYVHMNTETPLGPTTVLSLGMNEEAITIMKAIANVLGGYLEENDCAGTGEMIQGNADHRSDGLMYFVTSGIKENKFENDGKSVEELKEYIMKWEERHRRR